MAVLSKGQTFATGDQVTALKLNDLVDDATFVAGAVDNASTQLSGGAIIVKDGGITTAKIDDEAVTTAKIDDEAVTTDKIDDGAVFTSKINDGAVTKEKIENLSDYTVLGNVSGGAAAPAEVLILDEDDMASDSDTAIATQQSIKAYVDNTGIFTKSFESAEQNVPAATDAVLTIAHSLGEIPKLIEKVYRCKNNNNGWIAGDEIVAFSQSDSGQGHFSVVKNTTEIKFRGTSNIRRFAHGTGIFNHNLAFTPTSPNWKIVFRAYA